MIIVYKKWKKYDEIQLTKNKMDLYRKMTNHPPSPGINKIYGKHTLTEKLLLREAHINKIRKNSSIRFV